MCSKNTPNNHIPAPFIAGMNCEQGLTPFELVTYFMVNDNPNRMIHRIALFLAPSAKCQRRFAHVAGQDLG
jgi:hypothetical protein